MASFSRSLIAFLLVSLLLISVLEDHPAMAYRPRGYPRRINCPSECKRRCSKAFWDDKCHDGCMACCHKCSCVPPGTYGNKAQCSCYNNLKNSKNGKPKCP